MKVTAKAKYLRSSAQKLRLSADLVRSMRADDAMELLQATNKKSAGLVYDALKSATANAEHNNNLSKNKLFIEEIMVDEGPRLKRFRPRARGSAGRILKRTSHLTIVVSDQQPAKIDKQAEVAKLPKQASVAKPDSKKAITKADKE